MSPTSSDTGTGLIASNVHAGGVSGVPKSRNLAPKMPRPKPSVTPPKMRAPKMPRPVPGGKK